MGRRAIDDKTLRTLISLRDGGATWEEVSTALDIPKTSCFDYYKAHQHGEIASTAPEPEFTLPQFPDADVPAEEIIAHLCKRFERKRDSFDAHTWFEIKVNSNEPMGLTWFGDPHVDNTGCDWPTLRRDVEIVASTPRMYGANIGDTNDNWQGRLAALWAKSDVSQQTGRKLAEWLMLDSGVEWLVWLVGNHDAWGDGAAVLEEMAKRHGTHKLVMHDWECRFVLVFPNGYRCKIYCSHDFKGTSIYNKMHGPLRESLMGDDANLYVCGHKHESGIMETENPARGHDQALLRVRGYKFMDDFARRHGYKEQRSGQSSVSIIDPNRRRVTVMKDVEDGADFLRMRLDAYKKKEAAR